MHAISKIVSDHTQVSVNLLPLAYSIRFLPSLTPSHKNDTLTK